MIPTISEIEKLHKKYAPNDTLYNLVYTHCQVVCEIALWAAVNIPAEVDLQLLEAASLLHDIGTYAFFNDEGTIMQHSLYPQHAMLGSKIVADEGLDPRIADLISTHVLMGLTKQEIIDEPWHLPARDYEPHTIEGELLNYGDRFHSKEPVFNSYVTFQARLNKNLPLQGKKFEEAAKKFGIPDIEALAKKYGHPVR